MKKDLPVVSDQESGRKESPTFKPTVDNPPYGMYPKMQL